MGGGGRSCKQHQGEHWKTIFKKISSVILRGGEIDTRGGGGECHLHPPKYTPDPEIAAFSGPFGAVCVCVCMLVMLCVCVGICGRIYVVPVKFQSNIEKSLLTKN